MRTPLERLPEMTLPAPWPVEVVRPPIVFPDALLIDHSHIVVAQGELAGGVGADQVAQRPGSPSLPRTAPHRWPGWPRSGCRPPGPSRRSVLSMAPEARKTPS